MNNEPNLYNRQLTSLIPTISEIGIVFQIKNFQIGNVLDSAGMHHTTMI